MNYSWKDVLHGSQSYKEYIHDLFLTAYSLTHEAKYLEPMRLEYELASKYGSVSKVSTGARLQEIEEGTTDGSKLVIGNWLSGEELEAARRRGESAPASSATETEAQPGTEEWVGKNLMYTGGWLGAKRILEGRQGKLENDVTKKDIIRTAGFTKDMLKFRWPLMTTEASATDRAAFVGIMNPFIIYTGGQFGGPLLEAAVTYENTTKDFAAVVLGTDPQGLRILYYSLTPDTREIGICPWHLEPGAKYHISYGPDSNDDDVMDSVTEGRDFVLSHRGVPIPITVVPKTVYVVEVEQIEKPAGAGLAADPGLSDRDIRYEAQYHLLLARIHNLGSAPIRNVKVAAYDGDPEKGAAEIGSAVISNIEAPNDLEPRTVTVGFPWAPSKDVHDIYVVVDPDAEIKEEITTFNNKAHKTLPEKGQVVPGQPVPAGA